MSDSIQKYPFSGFAYPTQEHDNPHGTFIYSFTTAPGQTNGTLGLTDAETAKMFDVDSNTYGIGMASSSNSRGTKATAPDITEEEWNNPKAYKKEIVFKAKMVMWPSTTMEPAGVKHNLRFFFLNSGDDTWGIEDGFPYLYKYGVNWWRPVPTHDDIEFPQDGWPNPYAEEATPNTWDTYAGPTPSHDWAGPGAKSEIRIDITGKSFDWLQDLYFMGQFTYGTPTYMGVISGRVIADIYACYIELTLTDDNFASATLTSCG